MSTCRAWSSLHTIRSCWPCWSCLPLCLKRSSHAAGSKSIRGCSRSYDSMSNSSNSSRNLSCIRSKSILSRVCYNIPKVTSCIIESWSKICHVSNCRRPVRKYLHPERSVTLWIRSSATMSRSSCKYLTVITSYISDCIGASRRPS